MCHMGNFNMSYESRSSYEARKKLHDLKKTDPKFWDQLTPKALLEVDIPANECIAEDEDAANPLFEDDSDLPCDMIIANVLGFQPMGVKLTTAGDMVSTVVAESLDANKMERTSDHVEDKDDVGMEEIGELGCGCYGYWIFLIFSFLFIFLDKETQHDPYLNPCSKFILIFLDIIYSQMTPFHERSFLLKLKPLSF